MKEETKLNKGSQIKASATTRLSAAKQLQYKLPTYGKKSPWEGRVNQRSEVERNSFQISQVELLWL